MRRLSAFVVSLSEDGVVTGTETGSTGQFQGMRRQTGLAALMTSSDASGTLTASDRVTRDVTLVRRVNESVSARADVRGVRDGEVLRVGEGALTAHATPGHSRGGTIWTWRSCESRGVSRSSTPTV
jgi:metallo-beta-lactamase class B